MTGVSTRWWECRRASDRLALLGCWTDGGVGKGVVWAVERGVESVNGNERGRGKERGIGIGIEGMGIGNGIGKGRRGRGRGNVNGREIGKRGSAKGIGKNVDEIKWIGLAFFFFA